MNALLIPALVALTSSSLVAQTSDSARKCSDPCPDSSFVVISVIKSIAGEKPANEFFDIRLKFLFSKTVFALASIDAALSSQGTDTVSSNQKQLTDAGILINYAPPVRSSNPQRMMFGGAFLKVFNTRPYFGIALGSLERNGSQLRASSFVFAYLHSFYNDSVTTRDNLFAEFFLRAEKFDFFKHLSIRGGVLFPLEGKKQIQSRIAIEVPVMDFGAF